MKCFVVLQIIDILLKLSFLDHISCLTITWVGVANGWKCVHLLLFAVLWNIIWFRTKNRQCEVVTLGSAYFVLRETKQVKGTLCDNLYKSLFLWLCIISTWREKWDLIHVSQLPIQACEWWVELVWCCWTVDFSDSPKDVTSSQCLSPLI